MAIGSTFNEQVALQKNWNILLLSYEIFVWQEPLSLWVGTLQSITEWRQKHLVFSICSKDLEICQHLKKKQYWKT